MEFQKRITLRHLLIENEKRIGLEFKPDKTIQHIIKGFDNIKWDKQLQLAHLPNTPENVNDIFSVFKGIL